MQNSFTFNGFNSIDLMNQGTTFPTPTSTPIATTTSERRASVGSSFSFGQNSQNQSSSFTPLLQQSQNSFFSSLNEFQSNQSYDANSSFQQSSLSSDTPTFSQYLQFQQQNQLQQAQPLDQQFSGPQENLAKFLSYCSIGNERDNNSQFNQYNSPYRDQQIRLQQFQQQQQLAPSPYRTSLVIPRRNSCSVVNSILRPVSEDISSLSFTNQQQQQQQQLQSQRAKTQKFLQIQQKIESSLDQDLELSTKGQKMSRKLSLDANANLFKPRQRTVSIGKLSVDRVKQQHGLSRQSLLADLMSGDSLGDTTGSTNRSLDVSDEKLAKTGNSFQRREDWSIIAKLPVNKQNTIDIRLEDEGPYGNDETRCFVLSHFSLLGVHELSCVFCGCELVVYDRFPLIDGTLFVSPTLYDPKKAVQALISNKKQYIYGMCLKCLSATDPDHKIECKFCHTPWLNGRTLQIGTLYKYDIFAAVPCCPMRVACKHCKKPLVDLGAGGLPFFSTYSEEKVCDYCRARDYHFIKPLDKIYEKCQCQLNREESPEPRENKEEEAVSKKQPSMIEH